jgi:hypothetical protein
MSKYRVELDRFEIKSIQPTEQEIPTNDTILEERTGDIMYVILHADNDEEAREKAERLANNLKNRS